jgi:sarcosine oxidase subunit beta
MFPSFARLKVMRQWGGLVDVAPDSSPIIGPSPVPNLYLNCGWGTGGFKAIPAGGWLLAHCLAKGEHHPLSRPFDLARFARGYLIDEGAAAGIAH